MSKKKSIDLHFYHKLLEPDISFVTTQTAVKKNRFHFIIKIFRKLKIIILTFSSIFLCLFVQKNKILFFNHTTRVRQHNELCISLYLNEDIFKKEIFYFIDDNPKKIPHYRGPKLILNSAHLNEIISLIISFKKYYKKIFSTPADTKEDFFYYSMTLWIILLKILRPRKILMVVWYGKPWIVAAANQLKIPIIDLQHGIIYEKHPFYIFNVKNNETEKLSIKPDECWVYGKYWGNQLIKAGWPHDKVKIFGYYLNTSPLNTLQTNKSYILYTTSCDMNKLEVFSHIQSIIKEVKRRNLMIIIAIHPREDLKNYSEISTEDIQIVKHNSYDLIRHCYVHISSFSTLLWEGLYFGKCTYLLDYDKHASQFSILQDLVKKGLCFPIKPNHFPELYELKNIRHMVDEYFTFPVKEDLLSL